MAEVTMPLTTGLLVVDLAILTHREVLQYAWEFIGDSSVTLPEGMLEYVSELDAERNCVEHTQDRRRELTATFAHEYATNEAFHEQCDTAANQDNDFQWNPQVEDKEEKEVRESATQTTEDTHGGSEATKSIEKSPSSADDGKEEKHNSTSKGDRSTNTITDIISALNNKEHEKRQVMAKAFATVLKNTKGKAEGGRKARMGWDGRAIVKHYVSGMLNRIPTDRLRAGAVRTVTIAIDCSRSCWRYLAEINQAIKHIARFYHVSIVDCSNGFDTKVDRLADMEDPHENRRRLEEAFCNDGAKMHPTITTPSIETAAKIAEQSEAFIVLSDYDGYKSICKVVQQVTNPQRYPWFIDLEEIYDDPSEHDWNYDSETNHTFSADDYPSGAVSRWLKIFPDRGIYMKKE